jgi:hypothetical protein
LAGASGARKSEIVFGVRFGRVRKSTGHSVIPRSLTWTYRAVNLCSSELEFQKP